MLNTDKKIEISLKQPLSSAMGYHGNDRVDLSREILINYSVIPQLPWLRQYI